MIAPFAHPAELIDTVTGIDVRTAQGILAEIAADMGVFTRRLINQLQRLGYTITATPPDVAA